MSGINVEGAIAELDNFIALSKMRTHQDKHMSWEVTVSDNETVIRQWEVVERVLGQVISGWQHKVNELGTGQSEWFPARVATVRAREALQREQELREKLGDSAPALSASNLHRWVWDGASSLWQSGHYRQAVANAICKLDAEMQNKLPRRALTESDLFIQSYSADPLTPNNPHLYRMTDEGSKTFKSLQQALHNFAEGVFAGIRAPLAHEAEHEMPEQKALEYLVALSVLARWLDDAMLEVAI